MKQLFGVFDLSTKEYSDGSVDVYSYSTDRVAMWIMGRAETENKMNCGEKIAEIFNENPMLVTEKVFGVYIAVIYDKNSKKLNVYHDRSTSCYATYFTKKDDRIFIGTSLKRVLAESKIFRKMNENSVEDFYLNGFIFGEETLLENVYKIKAFHCLEISNDNIAQKKVNYPITKMTKGEALDRFKPVLDKAIEKCFYGEKEINLPLSSGYDSNYNAFIASEKTNLPINAFSIGGKKGKNELPVVKKNIMCYNRMNLKYELTDENTLKRFPDIVWKLEGAVFEVGLPLQYELASLVSKNGKKVLVCGEVADQVMNKYYLQEDRIEPNRDNVKKYEFSEYPYIFGNYLILKKNGILANAFGIETRYPYLDNDLVSVCYALKSENMTDKRIHVANCNECLPKEVLENMKKIGGSTDCHSMFESTDEINKFIESIKNTDFYKTHIEIIKKYSYSEKIKLTGFSKIKNDLKNVIFNLFNVNRQSRENNRYFNEEIELRECLSIAYLEVFKRLFVTGDYDMTMSEITDSFNKMIN